MTMSAWASTPVPQIPGVHRYRSESDDQVNGEDLLGAISIPWLHFEDNPIVGKVLVNAYGVGSVSGGDAADGGSGLSLYVGQGFGPSSNQYPRLTPQFQLSNAAWSRLRPVDMHAASASVWLCRAGAGSQWPLHDFGYVFVARNVQPNYKVPTGATGTAGLLALELIVFPANV